MRPSRFPLPVSPLAVLAVCALYGCGGTAQWDQRSDSSQPSAPAGENPTPDPAGCVESATVLGAPVPMRRLTRAHVEQVVRELFGVTATLGVSDERILSFRSNVSSPIDGSSARAYLDFAESVVSKVSFTACSSKEACAAWLFDDVGPRLFRRPLDGELRSRYAALFEAGYARRSVAAEGAQWALEAMLQSPAFLYLDEPADEAGHLDGFAVASRLAYTLWGGVPDRALLEKAGRGELATADAVRAQAQAMLADPRSQRGLELFVTQWLDASVVEAAETRPDLQALGADVLAAMDREPGELFYRTVTRGGAFAELFTTSTTARLPALDALYGTDLISRSATESQLDPTRRAGLLTLPGVAAAHAHAGATSPTLRGRAVLANLLCRPPPPPPPDVSTSLPPPSRPDATTRERLDAHVSAAACAGCHRAMDGIGFAFEGLDAVGRTRATDQGHPIDDRSDFSLDGQAFSVKGAVELSAALSTREELRRCFAQQWALYAAGVPEPAAMGCYLQGLAGKLSAPGGISEMMVELAASAYLRQGASR